MIFNVKAHSVVEANQKLSLRCPVCRQMGTFGPTAVKHDLSIGDGVILGHRRCPNPACNAHLFFAGQREKVLVTYPAQRLDFDSTNIPVAVLAALEEAITCHASQCFTAAAIMVRKTLEELCRDRGAQGKNLKDRIKELGTKVVIPKALFDGLDDLRLLGNDAAHIESETYNQVDKTEVEVGIEFTKEVLKAVYQYEVLLRRLQSLKKGGSTSP